MGRGIGHRVYFDNYFSSGQLLTHLFDRGIYSLATIRVDRIKRLGGPTEAEMKNQGRGSFNERVMAADGV